MRDWLKWNDSLSVPAAAMTGWLCPHVDFLNPFFFALICADFFICTTANKKRLPHSQQSFQISYLRE